MVHGQSIDGSLAAAVAGFVMTLKISTRGRVQPFIVMDVMREANRLAAKGHDILHLEVGQPSTGAPIGVIAAAQKAMATDKLGYTDALGTNSLRRRIAKYYQDTHDIDLGEERVVVTTGSSGGFVLAFLSAFDPGDRVVLTDPSYPAYRNLLEALGIKVVGISATAEHRYQPTPALLDRVDGTIDGLIIASPANPTGTMINSDEMQALIAYCKDRSIRLISDEIYHGITYGRPSVTALSYTDDAFVVNSFSKYYSMTGWRVGWMVIPEEFSRSIECLAQNIFISVPALSQHAANAAFDCSQELDKNVSRYAENRELLLRELPNAEITDFSSADGAFYIYADVSHFTNNSEDFCRRLLHEAGVAVAPGTDFDRIRGNSAIRISFAGATETISEAISRLKTWVSS